MPKKTGTTMATMDVVHALDRAGSLLAKYATGDHQFDDNPQSAAREVIHVLRKLGVEPEWAIGRPGLGSCDCR